MITLLLHLLRLLPILGGGHRQVALENLALRQQLVVYKRTATRPRLRGTDRLFWVWLARVWAGWRRPLVMRMAAANPLWGAPRIHAELLKLGLDVAERTVSRLIPKRCSPPSQTWRTFLTSHVRDLVAIDFFTVPTARLRV